MLSHGRMVIERGGATGPQYIQIRDHIANQIKTNRLKPGDQLPSFLQLQRTFAVSGATLNRAIHELKHAGWVTSRRGSGIFVGTRALSPESAVEENPLQLRVPKLEPLFASRTAEFLNRFQRRVPGAQVIETNERQTVRMVYGPILPCLAGELEDLTPHLLHRWGRENVCDPVIAPLCHSGRLLFVPHSISVIAAQINTRLLAEAGIPPPSADWSLEDLLDLAERLHDPARNRWGIHLRPSYSNYMYLLWHEGGEFFSDDGLRCTLDTSAAVRAMTMLGKFHCLSGPHSTNPLDETTAVVLTPSKYYARLSHETRQSRVLRPLPGYRRGIAPMDLGGLALRRGSAATEAAVEFMDLMLKFPPDQGKMALHPDRSLEDFSPETQAFRDTLPYARHVFSNIPPEARSVQHDMALHLFAAECPDIAQGDPARIEERLRILTRHMTAIISEHPRMSEHQRMR